MSVYVISKLSNAVAYCFYEHHGSGHEKGIAPLPTIRKKIIIRGGAGMPSIRHGFGEVSEDSEGRPMWTPEGTVTTIEDADYELLKDHRIFKQHVEGGFLKVVNRDVTGNHKAVAKEVQTMQKEDGYGLMTPEKLKQRIKVTTKRLHEEDEFRN